MFKSEESCWIYLEPECPVFDIGSGYFWLVFATLVSLICFDVSYILRTCYDRTVARMYRQSVPPPLLSAHVYKGLCLTTNMNFSRNMGCSASFLRECGFAFRDFLIRSHLEKALKRHKAILSNSSNNLKFHKSLHFLQTYSIHTRLAWWDNNSLYVEQKLMSEGDRGMVCALNYSRQTVRGTSALHLLQSMSVCSCLPPYPPPEIQSWMVCINVVNQQLTLNGHC